MDSSIINTCFRAWNYSQTWDNSWQFWTKPQQKLQFLSVPDHNVWAVFGYFVWWSIIKYPMLARGPILTHWLATILNVQDTKNISGISLHQTTTNHPTFCGDFSIFLLLPPNFPNTRYATMAMLSSGLCNVLHSAYKRIRVNGLNHSIYYEHNLRYI